jgi:V/A-type H+-transporting ATPase subunit I
MLSPAEMRKVRMVILARDEDRVARALGELGLLHLRSAAEASEGRLAPQEVADKVKRCRVLQERLGKLAEKLPLSEGPAAPGQPASAMPLSEIEKVLGTLEGAAGSLLAELAQAQEALGDVQEVTGALAPLRGVRSSLRQLADSPLVDMRVGAVGSFRLGPMRRAMPDGVLLIPLTEEEDRPADVLVVSSRRRRYAMETVLAEHRFEPKSVPPWEQKAPAAVYEEALRRRDEVQRRIVQLRERLGDLARPYAQRLRKAAHTIAVQLRLYEAEATFGTTWATAVVSGWVPADRAERLREAVGRVTQGRAVVEVSPPDKEEIEAGRVPTYLEHARWLAPFAGLVRGYGVPNYTEIEPTVLFAASFLLMFGLIFGDLGHGLCLLALGLAARRWGRSTAVRDAGWVVALAGASGILFGTFFQGSFFGKSLLDMGFPVTLGFEPIRFEGAEAGGEEHVMRYLFLAIVLGIVLISLGAVLNIVNRLRRGDYEGGLLGKFGVVGILFYWGTLAFAVKLSVAGAGSEDVWLALALVGVPLVVLALHEPIYALLTRRKPLWAENPLMGFFGGLIEAMETVMVYLANTFSFLRVAAFALSHAALCFTIFVLERLVNGLPGGPVWSAAVFVLGTAVIIGLEGLIVTIQIMRLEYYEFFTKFFAGEGVRYQPFRLE